MTETPSPRDRISDALRTANADGKVGLIPFITAGYPDKDVFVDTLKAIACEGDVVEVGVPFSDPMADGVTIQRSSHAAIAAGVSLQWILDELKAAGDIGAPIVLMSYLNPLLAFGFDELAEKSAAAGVCGFIVPDLPWEESESFRHSLDSKGLALVQLVTPVTPDARLELLCKGSQGFVYAVTITGITGGDVALPPEVTNYLDQVNSHTELPVCAGFGVRHAEQVDNLGKHASGVIVGSALVERLEAGDDPAAFLASLRA
ncbi:MAG: tryptophan synthase subunit alpha [Gammaproteobacteria bacterium]|nr:tryptophan synthase subunit alpha [Chromatiales bacterium]MDP6149765.1 tryptophan synthase subunit alpha [Gammaproteobacteria bacterium]MDP7092813.1 tryptophan synthase subunit alpha [Gammaproteobacteria bacterium]MDP7270120.1 tryptophan synthase subunit alpha [Gammaproteobacteria bacterium]MDP7419056.1 tryptophan synthase subunit alpha [Gammaproteobacteria bacterium]